MLYFVSTPIGNLKDISFRAVEVLKQADVIACEDTRHSLVLLNAYDIKKPLISYHKFNESNASDKIIELLRQGKEVAVISDAGTPIISDPGDVLSKKLIENNLPYTVVPGACAFVPALILSGLNEGRFYFYGFLPDKKGDIKRELESLNQIRVPIIFYCAPHDLTKTVDYLYEFLGERKAVAVKEITKIHEQRFEFNLSEGYSGELKGEFVLIVEGNKQKQAFPERIEQHLKYYLDKGLTKNEAIKQVAKDRGVHKSEVYALFTADAERK